MNNARTPDLYGAGLCVWPEFQPEFTTPHISPEQQDRVVRLCNACPLLEGCHSNRINTARQMVANGDMGIAVIGGSAINLTTFISGPELLKRYVPLVRERYGVEVSNRVARGYWPRENMVDEFGHITLEPFKAILHAYTTLEETMRGNAVATPDILWSVARYNTDDPLPQMNHYLRVADGLALEFPIVSKTDILRYITQGIGTVETRRLLTTLAGKREAAHQALQAAAVTRRFMGDSTSKPK